MRKKWIGLAVVSLVGCVVTGPDAPTPGASSSAPTASGARGASGANAAPSRWGAPADPRTIDALIANHRIADATSLRVTGDASSADMRVRMQLRAAQMRPMAVGSGWAVATGSAVHASPATAGGWTTAQATDRMAFGVLGTAAGRGIASGQVGATSYAAAAADASLFVLSNIYSSPPDLVGYAFDNDTSQSFGLAGLLFNVSGSRLYALTAQGNLYCFTTPAGGAAAGAATRMSACAGTWPYAAGTAVTWSSAYPAYQPSGEIAALYFGDDGGYLHCVNGTTYTSGATSYTEGQSCWTGGKAALSSPFDAAAVGPPTANIDSTGVPVIFVGDDKGRLFRVTDQGTTPQPSAGIASQDLCGSAPGTCASNPWSVRGAPTLDLSGGHVYAAAGGSLFEFPLALTSGGNPVNWQATTTAKVLFAGLNGPIGGTPVLDATDGFAYVAFHGTLYKAKYPFDGTASGNVYATPLTIHVTTAPGSPPGFGSDSFPLGYPLPWYGNVFVAHGANTASSGIVEAYGCEATGAAPILAGVTQTPHGALIETGMVLDSANGNLEYGFDDGAGAGGVVQAPASAAPMPSGWGCPAGYTASATAACGSPGCISACATAGDCPVSHDTVACNGSGQCVISSCDSGFSNCDGNVANGCEVDSQTNVNECGGCSAAGSSPQGAVCSSVHDTPACVSGSCAPLCNAGYAHCPTDGTNTGCPSSIGCGKQTSTVGNCCGATCTAGQICSNGACVAGTTVPLCTTVSEHQSAHLACPTADEVITQISFVSYGLPNGTCGSFTVGTVPIAGTVCDATPVSDGTTSKTAFVNAMCLGKKSCDVLAESTTNQGPSNLNWTDPCVGNFKRLYVQYTCGCGACASSLDCGGATPVCNPSTLACVGCLTSTDCGAAAPVCNTTTNTCSACTSSADCTSRPGTPLCNTGTGACVACLTDVECTNDLDPFCSGGACVPCVTAANCATSPFGHRCGPNALPVGQCGCRTGNNADCGASLPVCGPANLCVQCNTSADCSGTTPVCDTTAHTCHACVSNADCTGGTICDTSADASHGACVQCLSSADCGGATPLCKTATDTCVACLLDSDCPSDAAPHCNGSNVCVACANNAGCTNSQFGHRCSTAGVPVGTLPTGECGCRVAGATTDCASGTVCGNANLCVQCVSNAQCSGNTPICNTTTSTCQACATSTECAPNRCDTIPGDAKLGACVQCDTADLTNCTVTQPVCTASDTCTLCTANADCTRFASTPVCKTADGSCVQCAANTDCAGTPKTPLCDLASGHAQFDQCVQCSTVADCPGGTGSGTTNSCAAATRLCSCNNNAAGNTYCNAHWPGTTCVSARCQ